MNVTRVGFKFDCREKDLYDFMHEVRKEIVQDAWYLVPRITVKQLHPNPVSDRLYIFNDEDEKMLSCLLKDT